jgi:hypothetical protein
VIAATNTSVLPELLSKCLLLLESLRLKDFPLFLFMFDTFMVEAQVLLSSNAFFESASLAFYRRSKASLPFSTLP